MHETKKHSPKHKDSHCGCHEHNGHNHNHVNRNHNHVNHNHKVLDDISVFTHEGASVATMSMTLTWENEKNVDEIKCMIKAEMEWLRDWIKEHKGYIGHIKACVTNGDTSIGFSTTGNNVGVSSPMTYSETNWKCMTLLFNIIVFNISLDLLEEQLQICVDHLKK